MAEKSNSLLFLDCSRVLKLCLFYSLGFTRFIPLISFLLHNISVFKDLYICSKNTLFKNLKIWEIIIMMVLSQTLSSHFCKLNLLSCIFCFKQQVVILGHSIKLKSLITNLLLMKIACNIYFGFWTSYIILLKIYFIK